MAIVAAGLARPRIGSLVSFGYGQTDDEPPAPVVVAGGNVRRYRLGPNLIVPDKWRDEEELLLLIGV